MKFLERPKFWAALTILNFIAWVKACAYGEMLLAWMGVFAVATGLFYWWVALERSEKS